MKRVHSLRLSAFFFTLFAMLASALVTGVLAFCAYHLGVVTDIHYAPLFWAFAALIVSAVIGTAISYILSRRFLRPIMELIRATRAVAKGDFSIRVDPSVCHNELSELVASYNTMAEELGGIELLRKDFINTFSHEFKTPIVSIRGFAKQLEQAGLDDAARREYAGIIVSEAERLTDMSSNILLLTRFENQHLVGGRCTYRLDEQLRHCILLFEKKWSEKKLELHVELEEIRFNGNEEMVSHVWRNILDNAIKYSDEGGSLSVSARERPGRVIVEIADSGCGMDKATMERIFDKFYQGDSAHAEEGNGLGLPLVKRIVELCGGGIRVESSLGKGTRFIVTLPTAATSES